VTMGKANLRRAAILALAVLAAVALGACGGSDKQATTTGGASAGGASKHRRITLVVGVTNNPFYSSMATGAQAAAKQLGVTLDVQGAQEFSPAAETPILDAVIAKKPDGLVLVPTDPQAIDPLAKQAKAAGIVVATADIDVATPSSRIAFFASDNVQGGKLAGQELLRVTGGKGKAFLLNAVPGVPTNVARAQGFTDALKGSGMTLLPPQYSNEEQGKGTAVVDAALSAHPDLAGIFASDTINGQAVAVALKDAHKLGKVKAVGYDTSPTEVAALKQGAFAALIGQKPYDMGFQAVQAIVDTLDGKGGAWHGQKVATGFNVVTPANVDDPNVAKYIYR